MFNHHILALKMTAMCLQYAEKLQKTYRDWIVLDSAIRIVLLVHLKDVQGLEFLRE